MFRLLEIQHAYGKKNVLKIDEWNARQGEHWLLLGPSGSGKTTLLHVLGGLLKPTAGKYFIKEEELTTFSNAALDKFRAKNIGLVFQQAHLIQTLTVLQNLLLAQYMAGLQQDKKRCVQVLEELDIADKQYSYPKKLSQGEAQRVSVARAVINRPLLLLADEPTSSLDDANATQVIEMLDREAKNHEATLVIATHDQRVKEKFGLQWSLYKS